jgi:ribonuclease HI
MYDPATGEAMATLVAVDLCQDMGVFDVILEENSLELMNAIKEDQNSWKRYGHLVDDLKMVLSSLRSWEVMHVKREANMAAHKLAKEASKIHMDRVLIEDCPPCILDIVNLERLAIFL